MRSKRERFCMNPAVAEWVKKAEGDFITAGREIRARKSPNYDAVCFHCQQCAEKYMKAVLQASDRHIPKIHDLIEIMALCLPVDPTFEMLRADLIALDRYSVRKGRRQSRVSGGKGRAGIYSTETWDRVVLFFDYLLLTALHLSQSSRWQSNASGSFFISSTVTSSNRFSGTA